MTNPPHAIASLTKRLLALTYDCFLVFALCMAVSALYTSSVHALFGEQLISAWVLQLTLFPCLILAIGSFYTYCWRRSGQTLGMQTWRIKVINAATSEKLSYRQCWLRFAGAWLSFACLGVGFGILLRQNQTWHDRWSGSYVVDLAKPKQPCIDG